MFEERFAGIACIGATEQGYDARGQRAARPGTRQVVGAASMVATAAAKHGRAMGVQADDGSSNGNAREHTSASSGGKQATGGKTAGTSGRALEAAGLELLEVVG